MKKAATLFDHDLDQRVNAEKLADLRAVDLPAYWIVISPVEAQALMDGVVSTAIRVQAAALVRPAIEEDQWFT